MNKELIEKIIAYNYNEYGAEFGDALVDLKHENELLHHIIKEVREYIKNNTYKIEWGDLEQDNEDININEDLTDKEFIENLLGILDKENK